MITKNSNAKMMLMSTVAAVVFSFVFTTSANAQVSAPAKSNLEVRVKSVPKSNVGVRVKTPQKSNLEVRVKDAPKNNLEIRVKDTPNQFEKLLEQILGIRVRVRV